MAQQKSRGRSAGDEASADWPHLLAVGSLVAAIGAVLLLGAWLRVPEGQRRPAPVSVNASLAPVESRPRVEPNREPAPPVTTTGEADSLARRVETDAARLAGTGDGWTAQLMLLCDPDRVASIVRSHGRHSALHVLPRFHEDRACFLITWNHYADPEAARSARDLPSALRELQPSPMPRAIPEAVADAGR